MSDTFGIEKSVFVSPLQGSVHGKTYKPGRCPGLACFAPLGRWERAEFQRILRNDILAGEVKSEGWGKKV
jgi:hypothetical protein